MVTFAQPIVTLAPTAPLSLTVNSDNPSQLSLTTGGSVGAVSSVNGLTGDVTVTLIRNANGNTVTIGAGVPVKPTGSNPVTGDVYHRTDTPGTPNQRVYVCTAGGSAPTWSGIL